MKPTKETRKDVPPASSEIDSEAELAGMRILIVEDMGLVADALRWMLDKMGCHIVGVASRLSQAKELAQTSEGLAGVLLDLNLSGQSSYPITEILHERDIPYIIMSGYDINQIRDDCASDAHLQKPFSQDDLASMMLRTFRPSQDVRKNV